LCAFGILRNFLAEPAASVKETLRRVVVQRDYAARHIVEKDSSLPLGMTTSNRFGIANPSVQTQGKRYERF